MITEQVSCPRKMVPNLHVDRGGINPGHQDLWCLQRVRPVDLTTRLDLKPFLVRHHDVKLGDRLDGQPLARRLKRRPRPDPL